MTTLYTLLKYVSRLIVLFTAIPIHECAHAWASDKLGDSTAKYAGRMTLNPFAHFDLFGTLCLLLAGFGWAKPVPVDPRYFRDRKGGMALSALAGPASNLLLAYICTVIYKITAYTCAAQWVCILFYYIASVNIVLGIFNLLPFPPFDGSRIFLVWLPERTYFKLMRYERYIMIGVWILMLTGLLTLPLDFLVRVTQSAFDRMTSFIDLIFTSGAVLSSGGATGIV